MAVSHLLAQRSHARFCYVYASVCQVALAILTFGACRLCLAGHLMLRYSRGYGQATSAASQCLPDLISSDMLLYNGGGLQVSHKVLR